MAPHSRESSDWQVNYPEIKMRSAHILRSKEWTDCTFRFEREMDAGDEAKSVETTVDAHRLILAMASPVFAAMFYGNFGDVKGPILINDIDIEIFKIMLDYIYTDEVDIKSSKIAMNLYTAANKYILLHLEKKCIDYLSANLNANNVCHVYEFSCLYKEDELKPKCLKMFSTKSNSVLFGSSFNNAQVDTLNTIYSMDFLNLESELELLRALVSYIKAQSEEICIETNMVVDENGTSQETKNLNTVDCNCDRDEGKVVVKNCIIAKRKMIPGVVEKIRFLTVTADEFASCQFLSELLTENERLSLLMNITTKQTPIPMPDGFSTSVKRRAQLAKGTVFAMRITKDLEFNIDPADGLLKWKGVNEMMNPQRVQMFAARCDTQKNTIKFMNQLESCIDKLVDYFPESSVKRRRTGSTTAPDERRC